MDGSRVKRSERVLERIFCDGWVIKLGDRRWQLRRVDSEAQSGSR
jgi:DNA-directed RNA polymerase delta subunit